MPKATKKEYWEGDWWNRPLIPPLIQPTPSSSEANTSTPTAKAPTTQPNATKPNPAPSTPKPYKGLLKGS